MSESGIGEAVTGDDERKGAWDATKGNYSSGYELVLLKVLNNPFFSP